MQRLREKHSATGILLTSATACSWYLDGARTQVALLGPPVVAVEIRPDHDVVHVPVNERDRLVAEELPDDVEVRSGSWHDWVPRLDAGTLTEADIEAESRAERSPLLPGELGRYRALSSAAASVVTDVMGLAHPDWSEFDLAAHLSAGIAAIGAEPVVVLAAGTQRLQHRHPLPTAEPLGVRAMAVIGARRHGLVTNLTRWVRFDPQDARERDAEHALLSVESAYLRASTPGARLGDILRAGAQAYADAGFSADEWKRHHQGGVAGYAGRDPRATPDAREVLRSPTAVAWNPSVPAGKVEDTVLVTEAGIEVLTVDDRWPTTPLDGIDRPVELQR